jgi:hypothetical protein
LGFVSLPAPEHAFQFEWRRDLQLVVAAFCRAAVWAPAQEGGGVPEAIALQVVVLHFADPFDAERLPRQVFPALQRLWPPGIRLMASALAVARPSTGARPAPSRAARQFVGELAPAGHRERRRDADVMERPLLVVEAEQQRPDEIASGLVPSKPGDDAVGRALVLDLEHRALARLIRQRVGLGDDTVETGAFEPLQPLGSDRSIARDRREVDRRGSPAAMSPSSSARRPACGISRRSRPPGRQQSKATNDAGVTFDSFSTRDAPGAGASAGRRSPAVRRRDDDFPRRRRSRRAGE